MRLGVMLLAPLLSACGTLAPEPPIDAGRKLDASFDARGVVDAEIEETLEIDAGEIPTARPP